MSRSSSCALLSLSRSWFGNLLQETEYGRHRIGNFGRPFIDGQGGLGVGADIPRATTFGQLGCPKFGEVGSELRLILLRQSLRNAGVSVEHAVVVELSVFAE